jgi:hypothetical protein
LAGKAKKPRGWTPPPAPTPEDWWDALAQLGRLHQAPEVERAQAMIFRQLMAMPLQRRKIDLIRFNAVVRHLVAGEKPEDAYDKAREDLRASPAAGLAGTIAASFKRVQSDESLWAVRWPCAWGALGPCACSSGQRDKRRKCGHWEERHLKLEQLRKLREMR